MQAAKLGKEDFAFQVEQAKAECNERTQQACKKDCAQQQQFMNMMMMSMMGG